MSALHDVTPKSRLEHVIHADHQTVDGLFDEATRGAPGDMKPVLSEIVRLLSIHAAAEEQVVYPAVREAEGDAVADHAIDEHDEMKRLLVEIDRHDDSGRPPELNQLISAVRAHVVEEEHDVLPRLRSQLGDSRMSELADAFEKAKEKAPTRPHPHAPSTPPGNVVAGAMAKPVDAVRDKLSGRDK